MTDDARSAGDQLRPLGDDVRALIRQEVRQGQAEMMDKAREAAKGSALVGAGSRSKVVDLTEREPAHN